MNIQLFSDLHIEFGAFEANCDQADVVIFAGDIHVGLKGLEWIEALQLEQPLIYVLGNHEYYKNTYPRLLTKMASAQKNNNLHILENKNITIDQVCFHGATLWTDFELLGNPRTAGYECQQKMNDYKKIRKLPTYSKLRSIDVANIHKQSLHWLDSSLSNSSSATNVVITHHAPSIDSLPEKRKSDIISSACASNLELFIEKHRPDYWLHGHLHNNSDYLVHGCRVICNPRGYYGQINPDFVPKMLIEI